MGGDKNGHPILTREVDHQLPEHIPCHRIDPGGGFVEDQHFRAMDDRHRQRQTLTDAQRQGGRQGVFHFAEHETLAHFRHPPGDLAVRNMKQAGVQFEVLPDGQFAIERESLRHIAHPLAGGDIFRVDRLAEQPGFAFAGGQQAGEHLHGGGFAAAVGAEEAEDFTAGDAEVNVVDGDEVAKAHGQPTGFDGDLFLAVVARRDYHCRMRLALRFRQQGDKRLLQRLTAGLRFQLRSGTGRQHLAGVHRHQPVKALSLFHVGGSHQYAHLRLALTNAVDKLPELRPGKRVDAGGGFIEDQQLRVVDKGAT